MAGVVYEKLHDPKQNKWASLLEPEKSFWLDIARTAISASDKQFLREIPLQNFTRSKTEPQLGQRRRMACAKRVSIGFSVQDIFDNRVLPQMPLRPQLKLWTAPATSIALCQSLVSGSTADVSSCYTRLFGAGANHGRKAADSGSSFAHVRFPAQSFRFTLGCGPSVVGSTTGEDDPRRISAASSAIECYRQP